eukprot:3771019-Amphidinium_carterae.1
MDPISHATLDPENSDLSSEGIVYAIPTEPQAALHTCFIGCHMNQSWLEEGRIEKMRKQDVDQSKRHKA